MSGLLKSILYMAAALALTSGFVAVFRKDGDIGIAGLLPVLTALWIRDSHRASWLGWVIVALAVAAALENFGLITGHSWRIAVASGGVAVSTLILFQVLRERKAKGRVAESPPTST